MKCIHSRNSSIVNHSQRLFEHIMHVGVDIYQLEEKNHTVILSICL